ncbi:kinase-like domain-containing protein [Glomus cerebriforme]|uniref:Kinase-like domain-containing protein n=1 Tax=Glomus cerebriforme TaxID=658196 RepID=A0A397TGU1_9GLOM|nr:kinase-like domain-containing protein [Glomus cerebriforme]
MTENTKKSYYETAIFNQEFGLCSYCNSPQTDDNWCKNCNLKHFQSSKWTSGNIPIDDFVKEAQSKARNYGEVIEWIPYNRLRNIQYLAQGGFSTIFKAIWLDGHIHSWNNNKQDWEKFRYELKQNDYENAIDNIKSPLEENQKYGFHVVLKSLNNSSNINENFLNEWKNHLQFTYLAKDFYTNVVKIYGITRDPSSLDYMIVLKEIKQGSLRSNLLIKKYNPKDKYHNLYDISSSLSSLHKCNLVHGDFHSGNLLLEDVFDIYISDFGLSRPADQPINSNDIYGVLSYMAPEVLRGKPYTKASDIYSFGIIMWEFTSGVPAFNNLSHDFTLSLKICEGFRPKIIEGTDPDFEKLMKKCWDTDPNNRPTADYLLEIFDVWSTIHLIEMDHEKRIQISENESIVENHPSSCYTISKFDFSAKINENLELLSSKIIINEEDFNNITRSIESLENCKIGE